MEIIDLRSDTVTRPSAGMRRAIAEAEVGDDQYGEDPSVNLLQDRIAELLGKDAALFVPSGTMANQIALRILPRPGDDVVLGQETHMVWHESGHATHGEDVEEGTFWRTDILEPAALLVEIIREVRPQVMVTYDEFGGYGHPDHIQAHRVAMYAASLAAAASYRGDLGPAWDIPKIYWGAMSESRMRAGLRRLREAGDTTTFEGMDPEGDLGPFVTPDHLLSAVVDGNDFVEAKLAAMRAHATQIAVDGPFFAMSNNLGNEVWGTEFFRLAKGAQGPTNEDGLETDLFAGL